MSTQIVSFHKEVAQKIVAKKANNEHLGQHFHNKEIFKMQRGLCKYVKEAVECQTLLPCSLLFQNASFNQDVSLSLVSQFNWLTKLTRPDFFRI